MKITRLIVLAVVLLSQININAQSNTKFDRSQMKELKGRCKIAKQQGWIADFSIGTCKEQNRKLMIYEASNIMQISEGKNARWIIESIEAQSGQKELAQEKARDLARRQLGKNLGGLLEGKIESGHAFITETGVDISQELSENIGAFEEIFMKELKRNKLVCRYEKRFKNGMWASKVTIAMDYFQFEKDIKKITKTELQERIKGVRNRNIINRNN